jgi:predicted permease
MVEAIRRVPGVVNVAATSALPLGGGGSYIGKSFVAAGKENPGGWDVVQPGYFETLGIRLLAGRHFNDRDNTAGPPVIILSESLAKQMFASESPLGKRVRAWRDESFDREVVGVVDNVPYFSLVDSESRVAYVPHAQQSWNTMVIAIRARNNTQGLLPAVRAAVGSEDKRVAIAEVRTMQDVFSKALARPRFIMFLLSMFAGVALVLAGVGIYGVLSYTVSQRAREIGIRVALGAQRRSVLHIVTKRGMVLTVCGIGVGTAVAAALTRLMAGLLFGVTALDPATFGLAALFLTVIALLACLIPAWRATQIDPIETLRYQ